jgi:hypothetical protein
MLFYLKVFMMSKTIACISIILVVSIFTFVSPLSPRSTLPALESKYEITLEAVEMEDIPSNCTAMALAVSCFIVTMKALLLYMRMKSGKVSSKEPQHTM